MLLYGRYVHPSLERVLGEDRSVQQAQFDLCLLLLAVARIKATKHGVKVEVRRNVDKSRGNGLFVLDSHA